jgi:hypothetical protein
VRYFEIKVKERGEKEVYSGSQFDELQSGF